MSQRSPSMMGAVLPELTVHSWSRLSWLFTVCLLVLALQTSCVEKPVMAVKQTASLSEEILAQLGTIAITSKPLSTPLASPRPTSGWAQGFSQGIKTGAYYGAWPGLVIVERAENAGLPPLVITSGTTGVGLIVAGGLMGGLIGGPVGALQGSSEQSVEEAMATLGRVPSEIHLTDLLRDSVIQFVRDETSYNAMLLQTWEMPTPYLGGYQPLIAKGVGSLLEIDLLEVGLTQGEGVAASDPPLRISLSAKTRLVRIEDGTEIDTRITDARMEPSIGRRSFADWAAQNGRLFREELPRTARYLAQKIVETLLLHPTQMRTSP